MSQPGSASSIKVIDPATCPTLPLYIRNMAKPAKGAHTTSTKSPSMGTTHEEVNIPIMSRTIPSNNLPYFRSRCFSKRIGVQRLRYINVDNMFLVLTGIQSYMANYIFQDQL